MYYIVYKITNKINDKIYIGVHKTNDLDDGYMGSGKILKDAKNKHGIENFEKEILYQVEDSELMYLVEKELVDEEFVSRRDTYNIKEGGEGGWEFNNSKQGIYNRSHTFSDFQKIGAKASSEKFKNDIEYRNKQITHLKEISKLGTKKYLENCQETGKYAFSGKTHTIEAREKISKALSIINSGENNPNYGKRWVYNMEDEISFQIKGSEEIPPGFNLGRVVDFDTLKKKIKDKTTYENQFDSKMLKILEYKRIPSENEVESYNKKVSCYNWLLVNEPKSNKQLRELFKLRKNTVTFLIKITNSKMKEKRGGRR